MRDNIREHAVERFIASFRSARQIQAANKKKAEQEQNNICILRFKQKRED